MLDAVERRRQVGVQHPPTPRVGTLERQVDRCDRVLTATTRPEAIRPRLEPCLPLGLQRVDHPCLQHAIHDHRNPQRTLLVAACLRDEHSLDRQGVPRRRLVMDPRDQLRLVPGSHDDLPVDARRQAASVALRHPAHAQQRVRARTEHQLLQIADLLEVPCLRRREDPLPQTPYAVLDRTPVDRMPIQDLAPRSVHRNVTDRPAGRWWRLGVQLVRRLGRRRHGFLTGSPASCQHPFGSGTSPYPASYPPTRRWRPTPCMPAGSCRLSATGIRFWGILCPLRN